MTNPYKVRAMLVLNNDPVNSSPPTISGTALVGNALSATTGTWTDADGDPLVYYYQWYRADDGSGTNKVAIAAANSASYTLTSSDAHKHLSVVVTASDGNGGVQTAVSSSKTVLNGTPVANAAPFITGTVQVGIALSASQGSWSDADGDGLTYSYQWYRADDSSGTNSAAITGAESSGYTPTIDDAHKYLRMVVTANDGNGGVQSANSGWAAVVNSRPVNSAVPSVTGLSKVGKVLTATNGTWTDADGDSPAYSYLWYRADDENGTNEVVITGAATASYTPTADDELKYLRVVVTADDGLGGTEDSFSMRMLIAPENVAPTPSAAVVGNSGVVDQAFAGTATPLTVQITYSDVDGNLDPATIDVNDLTITRNGGEEAPIVTDVLVTGSGDSRTVTYSIALPNNASWDDGWNGNYTIALNDGQVGDSFATPAYITANSGIASFAVTLDTSVAVPTTLAPVSSSPLASSVDFTVIFAENVTGVDAGDFTLTADGTASGTIASITGSGSSYTVTVNDIAGAGTLRLDLHDTGTGIQDAVGNLLSTGRTGTAVHSVAREAPALGSGTVVGTRLVLIFDRVLDGLSDPSPDSFTVLVDGKPVAVTAADAEGLTVTLSLAEGVTIGQSVVLDYTVPATSPIRSSDGIDTGALLAVLVTNDTMPPGTPGDPPPQTPPVTELVDGVPVDTSTGTDSAGTPVQIITIPVVTDSRSDSGGAPTYADIPLVRDGNGNPLLQVGVPAGVGMVVQGPPAASNTPAEAETSLIRAIEALTTGGNQAGDRAELVQAGQSFLAALPADTHLFIRIVTPSVPEGGAAPSAPVLINGADNGGGETRALLVIDARNLPPDTAIQLENVEFAVIVGAVRVIGGTGSQVVSGDSRSQYIVLGADDDILHGGGGDDVIGSAGGNDQLFGDSGNDRLFGGIGDDTLDGGTGVDVARFNGRSSDFLLSHEANATLTVADKRDGGEGTDTLIGIELLRFDDGVRPTSIPDTGKVPDEGLYLFLNPDVAAAVRAGIFTSGAEHFRLFGQAEGRSAVLMVDETFYRTQNADVDAAITAGTFTSATQHFVLFGIQEGRDPNALFATDWYLARNSDVAAAVQAGTTTAWQHYNSFGWQEGRDASVWFDTGAYLTANADVALAGINPLAHLFDFGLQEGRLAQSNDTGLW